MAEIEVTITCRACGEELKVIVLRGNEVEAIPCEGCMLESYNDGYDTAKREAYNG